GRSFFPAPGVVTTYVEPGGPGVRVDSGIEPNSVIGGAFDSLLAKLIAWGESRDEALARSRRALAELVVQSIAARPAVAPPPARPLPSGRRGRSRPQRHPATPSPRQCRARSSRSLSPRAIR